jgi:hypothetical protein
MNIAWERVLPVIISIVIIIMVAILRQYSRLFAAIAATMPINMPLALWIAFSAEGDSLEGRANLMSFTDSLVIGLIPTFGFMLVVWLAVRAGWSLVLTLAAGYVGWGIVLGISLLVQALLKSSA